MTFNRFGAYAEYGAAGVILAIVGGIIAWLFCGGCVTRLKDDGAVGIRMGYDIAFYHHTSRTDSEAESEIKSQPLLDWLASENENANDNSATPPVTP